MRWVCDCHVETSSNEKMYNDDDEPRKRIKDDDLRAGTGKVPPPFIHKTSFIYIKTESVSKWMPFVTETYQFITYP